MDSPLPSGRLRFAVTGRGVIWANFHEHDPEPAPAGIELADPPADRRAAVVIRRMAEYFEGRRREPGFGLPIDWSLTSALQRKVLQCLEQTVPFGETVTYGALAQRSGGFDAEIARSGTAARMVGTIMGSCPIAILIPAHRVVAADGLGGFGNGPDALPTKRWLLTLEGSIPPTLDWDGPDLP